MKKRKIAIVVSNRASYARVKYLMKAIKEHPALKLQLIVGASTLLYRFGSAINVIRKDGFKINKELYYVIEGNDLITQSKTTALGILELSTAFNELKPDAIVSVADRFETMSTAIASTYQNIPLIHIQGGEISGNIDDRVRHAITKLADIHFVASKKSRERVLKMGEDKNYVFNFGCPAMDLLKNEDLSINNRKMPKRGGTGANTDWNKPYILMLQHPVTTSYGQGLQEITETLQALKKFKDIQKVVIWPNVDAGSDDISRGIRVFREKNENKGFHYNKNFTPENYARVLNNCICAVGNSSSFIREGSFLGVPVVLVGDRQKGRECGDNIIFSKYDRKDIIRKIKKQIKKGRYKPSYIFGKGDAGKKIAEKIAKIKLTNRKQLSY